MRTTLIALSLGIAALGGCAPTQQQELAAYGGYGNHLAIGELEQERLAIEAVRQLASIYAPAKTRLELKQPTPDAFGLTLVKELRDRGYAIPDGHFGGKFGAIECRRKTASEDSSRPSFGTHVTEHNNIFFLDLALAERFDGFVFAVKDIRPAVERVDAFRYRG